MLETGIMLKEHNALRNLGDTYGLSQCRRLIDCINFVIFSNTVWYSEKCMGVIKPTRTVLESVSNKPSPRKQKNGI